MSIRIVCQESIKGCQYLAFVGPPLGTVEGADPRTYWKRASPPKCNGVPRSHFVHSPNGARWSELLIVSRYITGEWSNLHDVNGLEDTLAGLKVEPPASAGSLNLCLDAGYISPDTELVVKNHGMKAPIRPRQTEVQEKQEGKQARRWAVQRSHSWLNR